MRQPNDELVETDAEDLGTIIAGDIAPKDRLRILKNVSARIWQRRRDLTGLTEQGAELLNKSLAHLPIRDRDTLHRQYGADDEVVADKLIGAAADQAGWVWAATAALPVPPPAAQAIKVLLHMLIELRLVAELYVIYDPQTVSRDAAWLNIVAHAWAVGHPVTVGPTAAVGVREISAKLQAAYSELTGPGGRVARVVRRGKDGQELIRRSGSRFRRRMRYHPSTWSRPDDSSAMQVLTATVVGAVRNKAGLKDGGVSGSPAQHLKQAWDQHLRAQSTVNRIAAGPGDGEVLTRLKAALAAQERRIRWLASQVGIKLAPSAIPAPSDGHAHDLVAEAHSHAMSAEQAVDRAEAVGAQARRLPGWPPGARNSLVYLAVSLILGVAAGWVLATNLAGRGVHIDTVALFVTPLCGLAFLGYGISMVIVGRLYRPWLGGSTRRSPVIGLIITLFVTSVVPALFVLLR